MKDKLVLGIDIGGTNIRMAMVDEEFKLHKEIKYNSSILQRGYPAEVLSEIIEDYINEDRDNISHISIGMPSTINKNRDTVLSTPNIERFDDVKLKEILEKKLNIPTFIDKDACMLLYNDIYANKIDTEGLIAGCYIGTGIGFALLNNGIPLVGRNGALGELGHIPVVGSKVKCSCGLTGCLEMHAGGKNLQKIKEENFSDVDISDIFTLKISEEKIIEYVDIVADTLAIIINLLDPDALVLGGGVVNMKDFPYELLMDKVKEKSRMPYPRNNLNIIKSIQDSPFNGVRGAAVYVEKNK